MNWLWMFLAAMVIAAVIILIFFIGAIAGYGIAYKKMNDDLGILVNDYKKALKENSQFFEDMADAINDMANKE